MLPGRWDAWGAMGKGEQSNISLASLSAGRICWPFDSSLYLLAARSKQEVGRRFVYSMGIGRATEDGAFRID